jgi:hypothetical protein
MAAPSCLFRWPKRHGSLSGINRNRPENASRRKRMTYRKLSRAIAVAALGATALMAFPASAAAQPPFEEEVGFVVECFGEGEDYTASVTLFQTTAMEAPAPASATVIIEQSDGTVLAGETTGEVLFDDGTIDVVVDLEELDEENGAPAGSATVSGTYEVSGRPTRVHQAIRDEGFIVVVIGTNTPLTVDLTLQYAGDTIALDCPEAFAFDLRVLRQPIGGN